MTIKFTRGEREEVVFRDENAAHIELPTQADK